jgi:hypothetical protein
MNIHHDDILCPVWSTHRVGMAGPFVPRGREGSHR